MQAIVTTLAGSTGLHSAQVDIGDGGEARLFPGYLNEEAARDAGRRFARALGADPGEAPDNGPTRFNPKSRRDRRRAVIAFKRAFLDGR